jgi:hypothetical protein
MTKDKNLWGSFCLDEIPPAPRGGAAVQAIILTGEGSSQVRVQLTFDASSGAVPLAKFMQTGDGVGDSLRVQGMESAAEAEPGELRNGLCEIRALPSRRSAMGMAGAKRAIKEIEQKIRLLVSRSGRQASPELHPAFVGRGSVLPPPAPYRAPVGHCKGAVFLSGL